MTHGDAQDGIKDAPKTSAPEPDGAADIDPDSDIIAKIQDGDMADALRLLMTRHGLSVFRYCQMSLGDSALADDVNQLVFIQVYRDLPKFKGTCRLRAWLFAIARMRVLDVMKTRSRMSPHQPPAWQEWNVENPRPGEDASLDEALRASLATCLAQLSEHARTLVSLRYFQGFSYDEMAIICNEKPGTLQARTSRALNALRRCIETQRGSPPGGADAELIVGALKRPVSSRDD